MLIASVVGAAALCVVVFVADPTWRPKLYEHSRDAIERLHRQHKQHLREQHGPCIFPILVDNDDSVPELVHEYEAARATAITSGVYVYKLCMCVYISVQFVWQANRSNWETNILSSHIDAQSAKNTWLGSIRWHLLATLLFEERLER